MEQKTLSAVERKERAKGANRRLRIAGKIPAVVYGHAGTAAVAVDEHEFGQKFKQISENTIINLSIDGKSHEVLLKDFQEDVLTGKIVHIDFYEVEKGRTLRTNVPVRISGTAAGVREGGVLDQGLHRIEVECLPKDIPDQIVVDVSALVVGDSIHVRDLAVPAGVRILNSEEQVVVSVTYVKEEVAAPAAAAAVEGEAAGAVPAAGEAAASEDKAKGAKAAATEE